MKFHLKFARLGIIDKVMCAFIYTQAMLVLLAIILCVGQGFAETNTRFTNVECEVMDPSFAKFLKCDLKIIGRGIVGLNIQLRYFKLHRKVLVSKDIQYIYTFNTVVSSG